MDDIQLNELQESLYQSLGGDKVGTRKEFYDELVSDDNLRRTLYNDIGGRKVGTYAEFIDELGFKVKPTKKSGGSILEKSPQELYAEATTVTEDDFDKPTNKWDRATIEQERKRKAINYANKAINDRIETDKISYANKPISGGSVISAMGELPSDRVSYQSLKNEKLIGFGERESRDKRAKEVFSAMPDFLDVATPEDVELAKYGEDYVKARNEEAGILAVKKANNQKEYDKVLATDNIILDDNINLAELSARSTLKNLANFMMPTQIFDAQARQEFALQDKQEAAAYDRYMIDRESAKIGEYLEYVGGEITNREARVRGDLHQKGWDWDQYKDWVGKLNKGEKLADEELQQVAVIQEYLKTSDIYKNFIDLNDKAITVEDEFKALPVTFKQGALVNKLERQVADKFTQDYASMDGALRAASFVNNTFIGGIERNFVRRPMSTVVGLAALAGMDSAIAQEIELAGESQQGTYGRKASRFMRPTHEKVGEISLKGQKYEAGFDEKGKLTALYDINGDVVNLEKLFGTNEYSAELEKELASQNVYDNAEWDMNWKSIGSTMLDTTLDVAATLVGTVGFAKTLQGAAALSKMGGLTKAANAFTKLSKNERLLEFVPMYAQYYGEGVLNGIRSGKMTVQDASLMSVLSTAAEAGSEALPFPMLGKLVTGGKRATSKLIAGMTDGNFMAALAKLPTRYARKQALAGFGASLLYETGEEFGMEYATPLLNQLANTLLDAKFTDLDLPTLRDLRDLAIITMGATIIPGAMGSIQDYSYFKSDDFVKHSLFKVLDPKNAELTDAFLKEMVGSNKLTQPEVDNFNALRNELSADYKALTDQGANNKEANSLRADIIGLKAFIAMEQPKLGTDENLNKPIQKKIDDAKKELELKVKKLQDTQKDTSAGREGSEDSLPKQDNKEGVGEDALNLPVPEKVTILGKEVNRYSNFIPTEAQVEPDAIYSFQGNTKDEIPELLRDRAYANESTINGKKVESWHSSINGDELLQLYKEKTQKDANEITSPEKVDVGKQTTVSEEVGEGNAQEKITKEGKEAKKPQIVVPLTDTEKKVLSRGEAVNQATVIQDALTQKGGKLSQYEKALKIGDITYEEVKEAVESAGLEVPDYIEKFNKNPLNLDMTKLDPKDTVGTLAIIKTKLQTDGILTFEDENGNKKENC